MKTPRRPAAWLAALTVAAAAAVLIGRVAPGLMRGGRRESPAPSPFQVKPYLQPGYCADGGGRTLLWQTADDGGRDDGAWSVEVRLGGAGPWLPAATPVVRRVAVDGVPPFRLFHADLLLETGTDVGYAYRVHRAGAVVFQGAVAAAAGTTHRVAVFGDCAAGTDGQKAIAYQAYRNRPDYVVVTGDVVYQRGRVSEYLAHFFPVYNHDEPSPTLGAPLLRSTVVYAAPGNHDLIEADLDKYPDGLAYFYYWAQPLNGPLGQAGDHGAPLLKGSAARTEAFLEAAGLAYPRMANFSFDRGGVHWTILDTNTYTDWTDPALRGWLEADLASPAARRANWRVVAFHHAAFSSSKAHADDRRMRLLAPLFEAAGVSVVFSGHVHNYQRSRPLKFAPGPPPADARPGKPHGPNGQVDGRFTLDTAFDGATRTRPVGVIYVVTGAGGARLYNPEQHDRAATWKDYTARFVSNTHSLTLVDVTPQSLTLHQHATDGREIDRIVITR